MAERGCLGTTVLVYCICNIVIGLGLIAAGSWMHASHDVHAYLTVFVRSISDESLVAAAALVLVAGLVLFFVSILGIFGVLKENVNMIVAYMWLLTIVVILGLVAGFMTVAVYYDIHKNVKPAIQEQLNRYYQWDNKLGKAWNRVQVKKRCCGADGSWDYLTTKWLHEQNPIDEEVTVYVPDSCCALNFNQDRELYWVDPQNLQLKDEIRCQTDAAGRIGNSANLHQRGCFAALFQINPDLWHDVTIFAVMSCIQGLSLGAGFLQWFGIALAYMYTKVLRRKEQPTKGKY